MQELNTIKVHSPEVARSIKALLVSNNDKTFTVEFIKKDGTLRKMNCRLGVKKHLKTGQASSTSHIPRYLTVFDMQKGSYRTINTETIQSISMRGVQLEAR